jgi:DedD protein
MIKKVAERSSAFVVVSRKTLITGMAGIAVLSFAMGYYLGYGGPSTEKMVRHVQADSKVVSSEEKTVLDSSGKPTIVMPPSTPDAIPKEHIPRPAEQNKTVTPPAEPLKKPETAVPQKAETKDIKKNGDIQKKVEPPPMQAAQKPTDKVPERPQAEAAVKQKAEKSVQGKQVPAVDTPKRDEAEQPRKAAKEKTKVKPAHKTALKKHAKKSFSIQVGAFIDSEKAERMKDDLVKKGYRSYIMTFSPEPGKKFMRVRIGPYETRDEAEEIIPELKDRGLAGILVPEKR